ncbi:MAG: UbiD family decarboxylase [Burkholderiales bacterium]|nr:UbiD family decarboxylase [Burkholderiales bacterium]
MRTIDLEKFRLRTFVQRLAEMGEVEVHPESVALPDVSGIVEASEKAVLFKQAGPQKLEMIGGVAGSRRRLAAAFGTDARGLVPEFMRRVRSPHAPLEVSSAQAPVHQVVLSGEDIDLSRLPFHLQHEFDGAPYISSALDFTIDPASGKPNVGCRRLMLRGRREMRTNLTQMSDLKRIYMACVERKERLPLSFVIGSHPADFASAALKVPMDEFVCIGALRGEPLPMVKGVSNGIPVPADAEIVVEGYLDERGYTEMEGPYGELYGYYGPMHIDPVFHATALTMRRDPLHHTVLHGGRRLWRNDASSVSAMYTEAAVMRTLTEAGIEVAGVRAMPSATGLHHVRVAIRQSAAGQARAAIALLFKLPLLRLVFVVDHDIDVWSEEEMDWAMCTRLRMDRDIVTEGGHFALGMDPATGEDGKMVKGGFDMTAPFGAGARIEDRVCFAPRSSGAALAPVAASAREALASGPRYFSEIMNALGSRDGREIVLALDALREQGLLERLANGQWCLKSESA